MQLLQLFFQSPISALIIALCLVAALTVHEWAHAYVAYKLGDDTPMLDGRVTLNPAAHLDPFGTLAFLILGFGWGKPVMINPMRLGKRIDELWVALAGPASNLVFATTLYLLSAFVFPNLSSILQIAAQINLSLAAFNMLPIPPLDGSSIVDMFYPGYKQLGGSLPALLFLLLLINLPIGGSSLLSILMQPILSVFTFIATLGGMLA